MLGYVRVNKPELKVKEYELYKGLYCSLCKAMGKHFGLLSRLTLSYDITFLVLVRLCFSSCVPDFKSGRCSFNPMKKCNYCQGSGEEFRYASAVSMMMFYHKVKDNISDGNIFKRLIMYLILPWAYFKNKKAEKMYPEVSKIIAGAMKNQAETERENTADTDKAAHESADALGKVVSYGFDDKEESVYRFGYGVGKWVYLTDAADDIKKDLKNKSFNVYVNKFRIGNEADITDEVKRQIESELNMSSAFTCDAFHSVENKTLASLCENIIYEGMEIMMNTILKGQTEK